MSLRFFSAAVVVIACWNTSLFAQGWTAPPMAYKVSKVDSEQGTITFQKQVYETVTRQVPVTKMRKETVTRDGKTVTQDVPTTAYETRQETISKSVEMTWKAATDKACAGDGTKLEGADVLPRVKVGGVILHIWGAPKLDPIWQEVLKPEAIVLITTPAPVQGGAPPPVARPAPSGAVVPIPKQPK